MRLFRHLLRLSLDRAITDFRRSVNEQLDLQYEADAFEALGQDAQGFDMLKVPRVYRHLCASQVLTLEYIPGVTLAQASAYGEPAHIPEAAASADVVSPTKLARQVCMVWLRQALLGSIFPVELRPQDIVLLPTQQIALIGGVFSSLSAASKKNLWHYLIATSTDDPDQACTYMLHEINREGQSIDETELRYRFREVIPFRSGAWSRDQMSDDLVERLLAHWQLLGERRLQLPRPILHFYRGMAQTTAALRALSPPYDPLREGLQDVRTIAMISHFQEVSEFHALSENLGQYAVMLMALPQKLNDVLTCMAEASPQSILRKASAPQRHAERHLSSTTLALLLMLGSVVLLAHHFVVSGPASLWVDLISAIVFIILGGLFLSAVNRSR